VDYGDGLENRFRESERGFESHPLRRSIEIQFNRQNHIMETYLKPTAKIDSDHPSIKEKAQNLIRGKCEAADKAKSLFYWVRDEIKYNPFLTLEFSEDFRASRTLEKKQGFCIEKAAVLAAFARAVGIPARLHFADIRNHLVSDKLLKVMGTNLFSYHGYTELYIDGKWIKATPVFDLKMCHKNRIIPVEFDGKNDAILHSHNMDGKLNIEYVEDRGYREDVPVDEILAAWGEIYGMEAQQERLNRLIEEEKAKGKKWGDGNKSE
jgi:transglutaminase-like putative cysteine protease